MCLCVYELYSFYCDRLQFQVSTKGQTCEYQYHRYFSVRDAAISQFREAKAQPGVFCTTAKEIVVGLGFPSILSHKRCLNPIYCLCRYLIFFAHVMFFISGESGEVPERPVRGILLRISGLLTVQLARPRGS